MNFWTLWSDCIKRMSAGAFLQALSLPLSLLVAWLTVRFTVSNHREILIAQEKVKLLDDICTDGRVLRMRYEIHFRGEYKERFCNATVKQSQREIQALIKALEVKRSALGMYLRKRQSDELEVLFDEWLRTLEGDIFPVYRQEDLLRSDSPRFNEIHTGHCKFEAGIAHYKQQCLRG